MFTTPCLIPYIALSNTSKVQLITQQTCIQFKLNILSAVEKSKYVTSELMFTVIQILAIKDCQPQKKLKKIIQSYLLD